MARPSAAAAPRRHPVPAHSGPASDIHPVARRTAWELLAELAPELAEWSAHFAAGAPRRARAEAGITSAATPREADDLLRDAAHFSRLVERLLALRPVLPRGPGSDDAEG
ncbi:SAV_6107 family HEPN domain-containing protein [Streptomyces sp. WAC08241]|uniref:SAV_6107 family HEPN domain-containing protein n=1 Tax=Streptomyces sp. WAC08241 TaxID=2487421 RepID=UPI000F787CEB|nr:SAV_6107 family HEPN domain-containing protein [Streptomyces sp. WAC08241]RSS41168.1 hypothetical protein EF906_15170 [Streptomyces sp. WAC08241]